MARLEPALIATSSVARPGRVWTMPLSTAMGRAASQGLVMGYGGSSAAAIPAAVKRLWDVLESRP